MKVALITSSRASISLSKEETFLRRSLLNNGAIVLLKSSTKIFLGILLSSCSCSTHSSNFLLLTISGKCFFSREIIFFIPNIFLEKLNRLTGIQCKNLELIKLLRYSRILLSSKDELNKCFPSISRIKTLCVLSPFLIIAPSLNYLVD